MSNLKKRINGLVNISERKPFKVGHIEERKELKISEEQQNIFKNIPSDPSFIKGGPKPSGDENFYFPA